MLSTAIFFKLTLPLITFIKITIYVPTPNLRCESYGYRISTYGLKILKLFLIF
jgi:hypothetical protein